MERFGKRALRLSTVEGATAEPAGMKHMRLLRSRPSKKNKTLNFKILPTKMMNRVFELCYFLVKDFQWLPEFFTLNFISLLLQCTNFGYL